MRRQREGNGFGFGRRLSGLGVLGLVVIGLGAPGCGGSGGSPAAVRVGGDAISEAAVLHWARVIAAGNRTEGFETGGHGGPRERALELLITAAWLRGEARALGVAPSGRAIDHALDERREADGVAEFEQNLRASRQTTADVRMEVEAKLAAGAIRDAVFARVPAVSDAEVLANYRAHRALYRVPEKRTADLVEGLSSPEAARALVRRIGIGAEFARKAFREHLEAPGGAHTEPDIERVTKAIFAARVGVASRPLRLNGHWTVFVVRGVVPTSFRSLWAVRGRIVAYLTARRRAQELGDFASSYRERWTAETDCRSGSVVQGCARYAGQASPQPDPFSTVG